MPSLSSTISSAWRLSIKRATNWRPTTILALLHHGLRLSSARRSDIVSKVNGTKISMRNGRFAEKPIRPLADGGTALRLRLDLVLILVPFAVGSSGSSWVCLSRAWCGRIGCGILSPRISKIPGLPTGRCVRMRQQCEVRWIKSSATWHE